MKVFVYDKKTNKTIATINDCYSVSENKATRTIYIGAGANNVFEYNTKEVKTRIYQN